MRLSQRFGPALFPLSLVVAITGCGTAPASAPPTSLALTGVSSPRLGLLAPDKGALDPLWPNDDGHYWQYHLDEVQTPTTVPLYDNAADVPPAPSVWDIAAQLRAESHGDDTAFSEGPVLSGSWTLRFDGRITTESGVEAQNLTEQLIADLSRGGAAPLAGRRISPDAAPPVFWSHLAAARPDLAPAVRKRLGLAPQAPLAIESGPILLHGGAWEKTVEHIGSYGDLTTDIAWLYLVADVKPGSTFDLQLVPALADDVWLHALVLPRRYASHPRPAPGAVEVLYLIDYGVFQATNESGESLGAMRTIEYGTVTYAPGVGPVAAFERAVFPTGPGAPPAAIRIETRSRLVATTTTEAPSLIGSR